MKILIFIYAAFFIIVCAPAQTTEKVDKIFFDFNPIILDSKNASSSTIGLEYKFEGRSKIIDFTSIDTGTSFNLHSLVVGSWVYSYILQGTVAASAARNPKNFLELLIDTKFRYSGSIVTLYGGAFGKYETDQSFNNRQTVAGLSGTIGKYEFLIKNDEIALDLAYGRVDPKDDPGRKQALGNGNIEPYYRWSIELLYKIPVHSDIFQSIELNYRGFQERGAPSEIRSAKLDRFQIGTIRLGLKNDFFIAYSAGKLPFDKNSDNSVTIGLSYKFK